MKRKIIFGIFLLAVLAGCKNSNKIEETDKTETMDVNPIPTNSEVEETINPSNLVGSWVEPNPINDKEVQGIELLVHGEAKSINMHTLLYKSWWVKNEQLNLVVESIGNRVSGIDTIPYHIIKVDNDSLVIRDVQDSLSRNIIRYKRK